MYVVCSGIGPGQSTGPGNLQDHVRANVWSLEGPRLEPCSGRTFFCSCYLDKLKIYSLLPEENNKEII